MTRSPSLPGVSGRRPPPPLHFFAARVGAFAAGLAARLGDALAASGAIAAPSVPDAGRRAPFPAAPRASVPAPAPVPAGESGINRPR